MKIKPILDACEGTILMRNETIDWPEIRDMVDVKTGSELPPSKLDVATQQLVNRLHKSAPQLLARDA